MEVAGFVGGRAFVVVLGLHGQYSTLLVLGVFFNNFKMVFDCFYGKIMNSCGDCPSYCFKRTVFPLFFLF